MKKKAILTVVMILLLIAFGISAFKIVSYMLDGKRQDDLSNDLSNVVANAQAEASTQPTEAPTQAPTQEADVPTVPPTTAATEPQMLPGYKEIYEKNPDTVGWIKIEGTKVNYPVMQTPHDRDYYLKRDFEGKSNEGGSIYAWAEADINRPSDNITLFGHNMKNGSMFAGINAYANKKTWDENPLIFFDTLYEYHTYKIFAVFKTSGNTGEGFAYHEYVDALNEEDFNNFISTCKSLAFYDTGITPKYGDKIICLSTCEYTLNNGRLVVAAVRIA